MDVHRVDLNLLVVFDALVHRKSVTGAAELLGLSQPATSAALARLRKLFDDPLFVRSGSAMQPTPRALDLAGPVGRVVDTVRHDILLRPGFAPARSDREFTLVTPDIGEIRFVPSLLAALEHAAPGVRLRTVSRPRQTAAETLESGAADLALGYFPDLHRAGFFQQKLFDNPQVCILREGHPLLAKRLTLKAYLSAEHAVVAPDGREHAFEQFMQQSGLMRSVRLQMSHFMSLLPVVEGSDLIATVPRDLGEACARYARVQMTDCPVKAPAIPVHQFWHQRLHKDAASIWLRRLVHTTFSMR